MVKPVWIVGNGLFGRIASDLLTKEGIENFVIDSNEPNSGSMASGNITKPSWVSGLGDASKQAYKDLDELYGLVKFTPEIAFGKTIDLYYVPRIKVIGHAHKQGKVTAVGDGWIEVNGLRKQGNVLIAAGVWSQFLLPYMPAIETVTGVSFIFNKTIHKPQFSVWAPYKQAISYQYGNRVWFGDGTAIKNKNWEEERITKSLDRAKNHGLENPIETHVGYRPFVKSHKNGYFEQIFENTWVSTGGGKNGIVLAAIQARKFLKEIL